MAIEFRCPECRKLLRTPDGSEGREAQCPHCRAVAVVPPDAESDRGSSWVGDRPLGSLPDPSKVPPPLPPRDGDGERFPGIDTVGGSPFPGYAPPVMNAPATEGSAAGEFNPYGSPVAIDPSIRVRPASRFNLASRGARFGGALIDGLLTLATMLPGVVFIAAGTIDDLPPGSGDLIAALLLYGGPLVINVVQWVLITARGQTLGKMAVGTRIVLRRDGSLPGFVHGVLLRVFVPGAIAGLCGLFALVDALAIFGREHRCLHDEFADTLVIWA